MVCSTIFNAGSSDTPLFASVPKVRAKRLNAAERNTEPSSGSRSFSPSQASAPLGVRRYHEEAPIAAAAPSSNNNQ